MASAGSHDAVIGFLAIDLVPILFVHARVVTEEADLAKGNIKGEALPQWLTASATP